MGPIPETQSSRSQTERGMAIVTAVAALVVVWLLGSPWFADALPQALVTFGRRNAEALVFFAIVIVTVPPLLSRPRRTAVLVVIFLLIAIGLDFVASRELLPAEVYTHSEPFLGAAIVLAHLYATRRIRRYRVWFTYVALLAIVTVGELLPIPEDPAQMRWIIVEAEAWGLALLTMTYFDLVRPWPFNESRPPGRWLRILWYLVLLAVPLVVQVANRHGVDSVAASGPLESGLVWLQRNIEAFVAAILIAAFFDLSDIVVARSSRRATDQLPPSGMTDA